MLDVCDMADHSGHHTMVRRLLMLSKQNKHTKKRSPTACGVVHRLHYGLMFIGYTYSMICWIAN